MILVIQNLLQARVLQQKLKLLLAFLQLFPQPPFQSPLLSLPFIDNTVLYSSSFYESGWEPHLRVSEAAATQYQVGMTFFLVGLSYMLTSLPAGAVSNMQTVMNNVYHISGIFLLILSGLQWGMVPHNCVHDGKYSVGFGLHTHRSRALLG